MFWIFFTNLYASDNCCQPNDLIEKVIPDLVTLEDNFMLTILPTLEEVKAVVFDLNGDSALGPNGFGGSFYQAFWNVIGHDVHNSVLQFFK